MLGLEGGRAQYLAVLSGIPFRLRAETGERRPFFFVKALVILDIDFVALYAFEVTPEPS